LTKKQSVLEAIQNSDRSERKAFERETTDAIKTIHDDIKKLSEEIDYREAEKKFDKLRMDILDSADRISKSGSVSAEYINNVYDLIEKYEDMCEKYRFSNNKINDSIEVIRHKYKQLQEEGKIKR